MPLDFIYLLEPIIRQNVVINQKICAHCVCIKYTILGSFHVRVALFKPNFLRDPCTEFWTSCVQMKAEDLRNPKVSLHVPIAASKLEL